MSSGDRVPIAAILVLVLFLIVAVPRLGWAAGTTKTTAGNRKLRLLNTPLAARMRSGIVSGGGGGMNLWNPFAAMMMIPSCRYVGYSLRDLKIRRRNTTVAPVPQPGK